MKRIILVMAIVVAGYMTKAQEVSTEKVPANVCSAVMEKHPNLEANEIDWTKEGNKYKAEFTADNKDYEVEIDQTGKLISSEAKLEKDQLPKEVKDAFEKSEFSSWDVKEVEEKESPQGKTTYKMELEKDNKSCEVQFDNKGKLIKRSRG